MEAAQHRLRDRLWDWETRFRNRIERLEVEAWRRLRGGRVWTWLWWRVRRYRYNQDQGFANSPERRFELWSVELVFQRLWRGRRLLCRWLCDWMVGERESMCRWLRESCFRQLLLQAIHSHKECGVLLRWTKVLREVHKKACVETKASLWLALLCFSLWLWLWAWLWLWLQLPLEPLVLDYRWFCEKVFPNDWSVVLDWRQLNVEQHLPFVILLLIRVQVMEIQAPEIRVLEIQALV